MERSPNSSEISPSRCGARERSRVQIAAEEVPLHDSQLLPAACGVTAHTNGHSTPPLRQHGRMDLSRADVLASLRRYLDGEWSAADLSRWADGVENPETIAYEDAWSTLIASVLFDLGTPEINGEPTPEKVRAWVKELETAEP